VLRHLILIVGIAIVMFPIYVTFVASSLTAEQVLESPMQLIPAAA
jgi:sn-glycerol 3-phosphate transport system permease protein